jgi:hypothetical protein
MGVTAEEIVECQEHVRLVRMLSLDYVVGGARQTFWMCSIKQQEALGILRCLGIYTLPSSGRLSPIFIDDEAGDMRSGVWEQFSIRGHCLLQA